MICQQITIRAAIYIRIGVLLIAVVSSKLLIDDLHEHNFRIDYMSSYKVIKICLGCISLWIVSFLFNFYKMIIDKDGIVALLSMGKWIISKKTYKWDDMEIRYRPFYIIPLVTTSPNGGGASFFKLLFNNFKPALRLIYKYGANRIVSSDLKYFENV